MKQGTRTCLSMTLSRDPKAMTKFDYSDVVRVVPGADERFRPTAIAWVIGVFPEKPSGKHFESFPDGAIYAIEFEDGEAIDIPESLLEGHRLD